MNSVINLPDFEGGVEIAFGLEGHDESYSLGHLVYAYTQPAWRQTHPALYAKQPLVHYLALTTEQQKKLEAWEPWLKGDSTTFPPSVALNDASLDALVEQWRKTPEMKRFE